METEKATTPEPTPAVEEEEQASLEPSAPIKTTEEEEQQNKPQVASTNDEEAAVPEEVPLVPELPDITQDSALLAESQEAIKEYDVLVCGLCHEAFHFVEAFQEHKEKACSGVSKLKNLCEAEGKPQVWGFTLWKNRQHKLRKDTEPRSSSWELYQRWCKLETKEKDTWISAGQTIQFCSTIASAKISEFKVRKEDNEDKRDFALDTSLIKGLKPIQINTDSSSNSVGKGGDSNKAFRTVKDEVEKSEFVVEKILAKRFNPRRKTFEYRIKWENFEHVDNTWEPAAHLSRCSFMLQEFETNLRKQKEEKAKILSSGAGRGRGRGRQPGNVGLSFSGDLSSGRPQRTSKQKAVNQVKAWCGNISDPPEEGGIKRALEEDDDADSDDSYEKKMKMDESEEPDTKKNTPVVKKILKASTLNNGVGKKIPQNVLIPDANGVVRINQKQLPSLSSGVYIMSKTAGIIKLDSSTSKMATSGGQTILKVAPKIGQTQIKIVKKEDGTTSKVIQMTPKSFSRVNTKASPSKPTKFIPKIRKVEVPNKVNVKVEEMSGVQPLPPPPPEDSDDGLEEMEFPKDMEIPAPSPPPGDFVLDPFTGKIAGQEYPEKAASPPSEPEKNTENSLENIVKLAAADITEDDLKTESSEEGQLVISTTSVATTTQTASAVKTLVATPTPTLIIATPTPLMTMVSRPTTILQKTLNNRPRPVPRILNQSVTRTPKVASPLIRTSHSPSIIRSKAQPPKPRFNISASPSKFHEQPAKNVYSKTSTIARKVGNTTIYKNPHQVVQQQRSPQARIIQTSLFKSSPRKDFTTHKKKPVINMPSLIDEPSATAPSEPTPKKEEKPVSQTETTIPQQPSFVAEGENPIFITGDDGTVYQVAGQNEQGQTILITQGSDGQQQCLLVTNDAAEEPAAEAEPAAATPAPTTNPTPAAPTEVTDPLTVKTEETANQVVAQVVRAEPPSPGGTHKVVVMLPDGNLMVTHVSPEEYASLELD